ncbi:hypothetical protein B566_EDAN014013 [Ephemera danica]|nr:hypothetical protein B566_EDAN014013 [Ephemera danica]
MLARALYYPLKIHTEPAHQVEWERLPRMALHRRVCSLLLLLACAAAGVVTASGWPPHDAHQTVKVWAAQLGKSLLELGHKVTKEAELSRAYKQLGALVVHRDGSELRDEIQHSIETMVKEKMDAVQCLMEAAERESYVEPKYADELENPDYDDGLFTYASAKASPLGSTSNAVPPTPTPSPNFTSAIQQYRKPVAPVWYRPLDLAPDPHFHNIPVNDTYSTVHVPVNVFDRAPAVIEAITWSENLDRVFAANYRVDPSLTWQYFGSARGFMRQFPGIQWRSAGVDLYDCRTQPWYISAVTCSKDVVLLMDVSGSMTGMRFRIARLVAQSLLDTLTSNDFVAVLKFNDTVVSPVKCFDDMLVQATKENVEVLKTALANTSTEGYGNITAAFSEAFQLLERYRESRDCGSGGCNQAIMLITDGVPGNLTETFETYNRLNISGEGETIPVRVFTYLLGKEVTNVREIQWMACLNRGYYTHMQTLEEVREEALRYLNVIARPLVLEGTHHPIVWTHAYADFQDAKVSAWLREVMQQHMTQNNNVGFTQSEEDRHFIKSHHLLDENMPRKVQQFRLLTSVSIPVFDRFANLRNNETRTAELLGVAGLDVPLMLFHRLSRPHKIGVNGYAFIVTNNGYILMHPNLRAVVQGHPRDNFNSVDLTEIELVDDDSEKPRVLDPIMLELRQAMVDHKLGKIDEPIKIKFAIDDMRRINVEEREFYYAPIEGTPFTLGLTLPKTYGSFTIGLSKKFRKIEKAGITVMNYFHGNNWKIHPDWDQETDWKWNSPFPKKPEILEEACGRPAVPEDAYYCDQELMERLMLEAKIVNSYYGTDTWDTKDSEERDAIDKFNLTMRFVATHSGLTRWQHVYPEKQTSHFGIFNSRAIDEDWYRAAVLLHEETAPSVLFSAPFDAGYNPDVPITGHCAIYHQDGEFEIPVAVAGFQMPLSELLNHLYNITEGLPFAKCENASGTKSCACESEANACYLLDAHGYVVVSEEVNDTGRFFGDVASDAMAVLHQLDVYRKVPLYDYQALCIKEILIHSGAAELFLTPLRWIQWIFGWIVAQFMQLTMNDLIWRPIHAAGVFYDEEYDLQEKTETTTSDSEDLPPAVRIIRKIELDACDKMRTLALLKLKPKDTEPRVFVQPKATFEGGNNSSEDEPAPYRSLIAQRVPHTNLLLVVVDGLAKEAEAEPEDRWSAAAVTVEYGNDTDEMQHPCHKLPLNFLPRRRLAGCLTQHPLEAEIEQCGRATLPAPPARLLAIVQQWAKKLGMELWWFGKHVTRRDDLLHKYKQHANLEDRSGAKLVNELAQEIENMMDLKVSAVKRIMDAAENTAMSHHDEVVLHHEYWNAKQIAPLDEPLPEEGGINVNLTSNVHFYNLAVNTSVSAVHVPTNVYDKAPDVLRAIKWSENLDNIFYNNYLMDPSLSWQYFGSSYGFMRQYPASQWKYDQVDLYDCRTRSWYVEAATSAKDVIILLDISGSMTGSRQEIARHVVNNILDTLGNNDFVNIFKFSEDTEVLVNCFNDSLVQATLGNVREMKQALDNMTTQDIANFTVALTKAFEKLQQIREDRVGGMCNQAIMLITDGVPFTYEEVFREFNWLEKPLRMPVRVFTYLIGLEVPDVSQVKWMACENQGYYVHLSTLAEVREQVLKYVQVMARPMVLHRTEHPVVWTPVYADIVDPRMTDYEWEQKECKEQKERYERFRKNWRKFHSREEQDFMFYEKLRRKQDQSTSMLGYQLMTSVSMPVFDRRENANITERILVNEAFWVKRIRETRVANLLGVAGTDVPIQDILKLLSPHQFQHILKPSYNSIDLTEIELIDNDDGPREVTDAMRAFREAVINQQTGSVTLNTRYHFDNMHRPGRMRRHYYYKGIKNTPFTLVVSLPDKYGATQVYGMEEIHRTVVEGQTKQVTKYLEGNYWRVHPDWIYCKYHYDTEPGNQFNTPELELKHFVSEAWKQQPHWKWPLNRLFTPPEQQHERMQGEPPPPRKNRLCCTNATDGKPGNVDKKAYFCDRRLMLSLLFDAKMTEGFTQKLTTNPTDDQGKELQEQIGITVSFVSTHTGLTRWHNNPLSLDFEEPSEERQNDTLVTASHALFINKGDRRAPVAVVGFQLLQSALYNRFMNITSKCTSAGSSSSTACLRSCASDLSCFLVDNHGYVVISSKSPRDTGRFFGEVQGNVMNSMPLRMLGAFVDWTIARLLWFLAQANLQGLWDMVKAFASEDSYPENYEESGFTSDEARPDVVRLLRLLMINRTRPQPCDHEVDLYELTPELAQASQTRLKPDKNSAKPGDKSRRLQGGPAASNDNYDPSCKRPYVVELVEASNLLMVVVDEQCDKDYEMEMSVVPNEVNYNMPLACYRQQKLLSRRNLSSCINNHPRVRKRNHALRTLRTKITPCECPGGTAPDQLATRRYNCALVADVIVLIETLINLLLLLLPLRLLVLLYEGFSTMEEPHKAVVILLLLLVIPIVSPEEILVKTVQQWAKKLGSDLWFTGKHVTRRDDLLHKYKQHANLEERSGAKLVNEIAQEVENMMDLKVSAVKIAPLGDAPRDECKFYVNLTKNVHFYNELVNTSTSVVHLPSNVYFNGSSNASLFYFLIYRLLQLWRDVAVTEILKAIKWSEELYFNFYDNYITDPSLSWQYFCSSFGFMRQYPASLWKDDQADLYDCRTRNWYVEAATSAKDIIILLDISGSMAGSRQEIARHVVNNILDTLGNNDFVNIYKFSNETENLVKCFNESLVQATLGNVREMKLKFQNLKNHNISNFTTAFTKAFETLEQVREERVGGMCNQAIMLITDGVPFTYEELFRKFNWMEKPMRMPVRVFTYLIGLEVPDVSQIKWIACENQGYYVHLSTFAEVREQDPRMTDYEWERRECKEQKDRYELYRHNQERFATREVQDYLFSEKTRRIQDQSTSMVGYQLMTSVSMPIFDIGENVSFTGNLLGVAGIDIPIEDIMKLMMPHQLGVNGYAFIITNNGFVLTHPDLRPVFQHILKPSYNSVDLSEIELMDNDDGPREVTDAMRAVSYLIVIIKYVKGTEQDK